MTSLVFSEPAFAGSIVLTFNFSVKFTEVLISEQQLYDTVTIVNRAL